MKVIVLSDFDGTLATVDVTESIYQRFGGPGQRKYTEQWLRGEISTQQEYEGSFATIKARPEEIGSFVATLSLDPAFPEFLTLLKKKGYKFCIVSEGLRWYIEILLRKSGLQGLDIIAGDVRYENGRYIFDFPYANPNCQTCGGLCATCKRDIVLDFKARGYAVVFIGDGRNDRYVADVADAVLGKEILAKYCEREGIPYFRYDGFVDIIRLWPEVEQRLKELESECSKGTSTTTE
ncbi:MAG: HAD-IB family phosphatase [Chloroflexi bacterium]|nr:HAD-IB family phosphatase [Chloroflexota bacterium]